MNVDALIEQAVKNVSARYNLNTEQEQVTRTMMFDGVKKFLNHNREEIWPLIRELIRLQVGGTPPDADVAKRLGPTALRLVEEAKRAILDANMEWRKILSDEQVKMHDFDLSEMDKTFKKVTENFESWKDGNPVPAQLFPPAPEGKLPGEPDTPRRPAMVAQHLEDQWDAYVNKFIRDYELNDGQIEAARSVLRQLKERAADYRTTNADKFAANDAAAAGAARANDGILVAKAAAEKKELSAPIVAMFDELKQRLEPIPDAAQIEKYQARHEGRPVRRQPTTAPATQEATTKPAPATQPARRTIRSKGSAPVPRP